MGSSAPEDLAGLGIALVVWASAVFAGYESYRKLVTGAGTSLVGIGVGGAELGIVGNLAVARYKRAIGQCIQSATLLADATHSLLDAVSSTGALAGLPLVAAGQRWGDPIAGFAVTLFIVRVGVEVTRDVADHLLDGVEPAFLDSAEQAANSINGVLASAAVGRWMGRSLVLEIDLRLAEESTIGQAQHIGDDVTAAVLHAVPEARRVHWRTSANSSAVQAGLDPL